MDAALQKHGAKHIYRIPEGLRELCADISREVLRTQPQKIYCFIADYIDALLITRENAKIAVRVVNNILLKSEPIIDILYQSGLNLEQIAFAATRIQKAFRCYLDLIDVRAGDDDEKSIDENSRICIREILETTGSTWDQAERAASTIQAAFRNHYKEMLAREARGEIQWQRAVVNTINILRKAGVSQTEAFKAATLIQSAYRGYYTRRNIRLKLLSGIQGEDKKDRDILEPRETIQAVAWMDMMFEDSKYTIERANEAASIIQAAFRGRQARLHQNQNEYQVNKIESSQSMVVEAILDNLRQRVWDKVKSLERFPEEFGSRKEMEKSLEKIETEYNNRQRKIRISEQMTEDDVEDGRESDAEEEVKSKVPEGVESSSREVGAESSNEEKGETEDVADEIEEAVQEDLNKFEKKPEGDNENIIPDKNEEVESDVKEELGMNSEAAPQSEAEATMTMKEEEHREHEEGVESV